MPRSIDFNRRNFFKGAATIGGAAILAELTGCMPVDAKAGDTPPAGTAPASTGKSPDTGKSPEAGALPTIEQWAEFTPEQVTQSAQDYLGVAKTPSEYAQRRVDMMNIMMQVGSTKAEVNEHMLSTGSSGGTYLAYVNERYVVPLYQAVETPGEANEANAIAWYKAFFTEPHLRYAISQVLGYSVPYEAKATIGETSVTKGDANSSATPFTVSFDFKVTDNFVESKVNTMQPSTESALNDDYSFTSKVVPSNKDGKALLPSVGTVMVRH